MSDQDLQTLQTVLDQDWRKRVDLAKYVREWKEDIFGELGTQEVDIVCLLENLKKLVGEMNEFGGRLWRVWLSNRYLADLHT